MQTNPAAACTEARIYRRRRYRVDATPRQRFDVTVVVIVVVIVDDVDSSYLFLRGSFLLESRGEKTFTSIAVAFTVPLNRIK